MDSNEKPAPNSPGIQMPGALTFEATLAPHESKTVALQVPPDYDFMLHCVTCRSDGPVLLKIEVAEEPLEEWTQKNAVAQNAWAGDDQAFLDLIGRDPRVVGSPLTVTKVVNWRTEVAAKKNLRRLGEVHIAFYDQRGKKRRGARFDRSCETGHLSGRGHVWEGSVMEAWPKCPLAEPSTLIFNPACPSGRQSDAEQRRAHTLPGSARIPPGARSLAETITSVGRAADLSLQVCHWNGSPRASADALRKENQNRHVNGAAC